MSYTPLHDAASRGDVDKARKLLKHSRYDVNCRDNIARSTPLHYACISGRVDMVRMLISEFQADTTLQDQWGDTPFKNAMQTWRGKFISTLITEFGCDANLPINDNGYTILHIACKKGHVSLVKMVGKHASLLATTKNGDTPLHLAAAKGHKECVEALLQLNAPIMLRNAAGKTALHIACERGRASLVKMVGKNASLLATTDKNGDTPLHIAAAMGHKQCVEALLQLDAPIILKNAAGKTALHIACEKGLANIVKRADKKEYLLATTKDGDTPLHIAAARGREECVEALLQLDPPTSLKNAAGETPLHIACEKGHASIVKMVGKNTSLLATTKDGDTPLHIAAARGHKECVEALLQLDPPTSLKNAAGETALHVACEKGHASIVMMVGKNASLLATTKDGDTPLHIAATKGHKECVEALLQLDAPLMLRNAAGKTVRDVAQYDMKPLLDTYFAKNQAKIHVNYDKIIQQAKKTYSNAERIVRVFVIGNPGAGKSSFVEAMKREGFFDSFGRVSESSVAPHTAGIVPSIYTSKHYGRVLFYDFAGDPEYYSSHAAILENLASSKGDNIFIIVVDLREDILTVRNTLHYWLSFIGHQCGSKNLITIGSHSDLLTEDTADKKMQKISAIQSEQVEINYFTLNCCKPRSKELEEIKSKIVELTKGSPRYKLSTEASVLLGLLEKDFSNVTACSVRTILSSIEYTGISLPKSITSVMAFLRELHEIGILFMIGDDRSVSPQVILNISKLTNQVHKLLFSKEAELLGNEEAISSFNIGVLPQSLLEKLLPQHITKECLVQLQYCQEISQHDVHAFPSLGSTSQSFLFFPALCIVGKRDVSWVTLPDLGYSIGWLARCANTSWNYFPPRFLHVLLLRLVFMFTLTVPEQNKTETSASPDHNHLKRRCTMWNCGVHWFMEEGVECMVELVNGNKGVAVITSSKEDAIQNCASVFRRIISCVMEAKADFCQSIRPQFFLFDPSQSTDYLNEDGLFAMSDVKSVLLLPSHEGKVVVSITGKRSLMRERIACLCRFTLWNSLFSLNFSSVHHYLKDVVKEMYELFIYLGLPKSSIDAIEANFPNNVDRRRIELVDTWMSSSSPDPPCWWQLVQALKKVKYGRLAQDLKTKYSKCSVAYSCTNIHSVYSQMDNVYELCLGYT